MPRSTARLALVALVALVSAACTGSAMDPGDGGSDASAAECRRRCEADPDYVGSYCGTDGRTYSRCEWTCQQMPTGVAVYPGACEPGGMPPANRPPEPADGDDICDWVQIGGEWMAVECTNDFAPPAEVGQEFGGAPAPGTPGATTPPPPTTAGDVDHRARFTSIRNQGAAPSCTSFAATGALESAVARATGERITLSEMQLWARYHTPQLDAMGRALERGGIVAGETASAMGFAYNAMLANDWHARRATPDATQLASLDGMGQFQMGALDAVMRGPDAATKVREALARGADVFAAISVGPEFMAANANGMAGLIADYAGNMNAMGHAVLIVGYRQLNGATYFIIRNSYGPTWGDGGYGYMSEATLRDNLSIGIVMDIRVTRAAPVSCPDGQSAALDGTCRMRCPDGSLADAMGQCASEPAMCAAGQVADRANVCVAACAAGSAMLGGASVECTAQGCRWTVPAGMSGCPAGGAACAQFCPAPTCALTASMNEFGMAVLTCAAR